MKRFLTLSVAALCVLSLVVTAQNAVPEIAFDSSPNAVILTDDIYLGEVGVTDWKTSFPDTAMPPELRVSRCLQKLEKIPA